jgi:hypothetical protein
MEELGECPRVTADTTYNANIFYLLIRVTQYMLHLHTHNVLVTISFTTTACFTRQARVRRRNLR